MAGYLVLANQQALASGGTVLGFINPALYTIGLGANYTANFHDVTSGSNGFSATTGYDLVTGWGTPNGATLINTLTAGSGANFAISVKPAALTVSRSSSGRAKVTTTVSGGFNSAIALSATGQGSNIKVVFTPASIAAPGAGNALATVIVGPNAATGTHTITITGTGGNVTHSTTLKLAVQ